MSKLTVKVTCEECDGKGYLIITALEALRKRVNLSQQEVSDALGLTRASISNIELGKQSITLDKIKPLADLYGVEEYEMYETAKQLRQDHGYIKTNTEDTKCTR